MKRLKKLKVLVSLLAMFSLFSLTNVSATEGKDKNFNKHVTEIKEEKEQENEKDNLKKEQTNNKEKDSNINLNEEQDDICTSKSLPYVKRNEEQKGNQEYNKNDNFSGKKTTRSKIEKSEEKQEKNKVNENNEEFNESSMEGVFSKDEAEKEYFRDFVTTSPITEEELEDLSKNFLTNCKDVEFDNIFENVMNCFGYYGGKQRLELGCPFISVQPFLYNRKFLENGEETFVHYNRLNGFDPKTIDLSFIKKFSHLNKYFGSFFLHILGVYYQYCFEKNLDSPIPIYISNGDIFEIDKDELHWYLRYFYDNFKNDFDEEQYMNNCEELIKIFLIEAYLKTFFVNVYGKYYDFHISDSEYRKDLLRFSRILFDAVKCDFDKNTSCKMRDFDVEDLQYINSKYGNLKAFNLDFSNAIKDDEDAKFLKRLYDVIAHKNEDKLLYDLYMATCAFLKNTEFWNKMIQIIVYVNGGIIKTFDFNYDALSNKFTSKDYFDLYSDAFKNMRTRRFDISNVFHAKSKHEKFFYKDFKDYDFKDSHERFKNIFLTLNKYMSKGFFNSEKSNLETKNCEGDCAKQFSAIDNHVKKNLDDYFNKRFGYSFKIHPNFEGMEDIFNNLSENNSDKGFRFFSNDFIASAGIMMEYLDIAVKNEKIKKECLALIRYLFNLYLTEGFIIAHGNQSDVTNISILRLVEYFDNILELKVNNNNIFGRNVFSLDFKDVNPLNYNTKNINRVIENIKNEEDWKKATPEDKMVYRMYLSAIAFVKEKCFWNRLLAFLVCNHAIDVAKNFYSDSRELYDEYKDINSKILDSGYFSDSSNYISNVMELPSTHTSFQKIYFSSDKYVLENTNNLIDFSKFQETDANNKLKVDKNFVDYISDQCYYKDNVASLTHKNKSFNTIFFDLLNKKYNQYLLERLGKNFAVLNRFLNEGRINELIEDLKTYGITERYCCLFDRKFPEIFTELSLNYLNHVIGGNAKTNLDYDKFDRKFYGCILQNKKIANECVSFIQRFFRYYIDKLTFDKNVDSMFFAINSNADDYINLIPLRQIKILALRNIVQPMLEWYSRIFDVKVKNDKIKFDFDLKYIDDKVKSNIKTFLDGFDKYNGSDMSKLDLHNEYKFGTCEEQLERFLYNMHVDAISFLHSEDFWNKYMSRTLFVNLLKSFLNENEIKNSDFRTNPFILKKEFLNVINIWQRDNARKYNEMLNCITELRGKNELENFLK